MNYEITTGNIAVGTAVQVYLHSIGYTGANYTTHNNSGEETAVIYIDTDARHVTGWDCRHYSYNDYPVIDARTEFGRLVELVAPPTLLLGGFAVRIGDGTVSVGCQTFPFAKVLEVAEAIKQ